MNIIFLIFAKEKQGLGSSREKTVRNQRVWARSVAAIYALTYGHKLYYSLCVAIKHINDSFSCGWIFFHYFFISSLSSFFKPLSWIMGCLN